MAARPHQHTVSATEARVHFGAMMKRAAASRAPIIVEKDGIPTVVILSVPEYEQLVREGRLARFDRLSRVAGLEAEQQGLTEEQLEQEMEVIRQRVHQAAYG